VDPDWAKTIANGGSWDTVAGTGESFSCGTGGALQQSFAANLGVIPNTNQGSYTWEGCCLMDGTSGGNVVTPLATVYVHNTNGTDTEACGTLTAADEAKWGTTQNISFSAPSCGACKSIKYAFHNRLAAGGTVRVVNTGTDYIGVDNMDLYMPGGIPGSATHCTRANMDFTIEGELIGTDRPVVDLQYRWSFIQLGRPGALEGGGSNNGTGP